MEAVEGIKVVSIADRITIILIIVSDSVSATSFFLISHLFSSCSDILTLCYCEILTQAQLELKQMGGDLPQ